MNACNRRCGKCRQLEENTSLTTLGHALSPHLPSMATANIKVHVLNWFSVPGFALQNHNEDICKTFQFYCFILLWFVLL
jgi:hypothetical protein